VFVWLQNIIKKKSRPRTAMSIQERMAELNNLLQRYIFYSILPNILQIKDLTHQEYYLLLSAISDELGANRGHE